MRPKNNVVQLIISTEESAPFRPLASDDMPDHQEEDSAIACAMMEKKGIDPSLQQEILNDPAALELVIADDY